MAGKVQDRNATSVGLRLENGKDVVQGDGEAGDQLATAGACGRLVDRL